MIRALRSSDRENFDKITKVIEIQNFQSYKMSKVTKFQNLQNSHSYKITKVKKFPKIQNFSSHRISGIKKLTKLQNPFPYHNKVWMAIVPCFDSLV